MNEGLTWDDHIASLEKRAGKRMYVLRIVKPFISKNELHQVYLALIRSLCDYCCQLFPHLPQKSVKRIQKIEKRAHKIIYGDAKGCECALDGLVTRRQDLCKKLFLDILKNAEHPLHERMPNKLPHRNRFRNFACRTDTRLKSFFPYMSLLMNP